MKKGIALFMFLVTYFKQKNCMDSGMLHFKHFQKYDTSAAHLFLRTTKGKGSLLRQHGK